MLDFDLAFLYELENKRLKASVRRNINRFPEDFMFEMTKEEFAEWRSQNVTSKEDKQGLRYAPFCFTEYGVLMLSSILNSERAVQVNIQIMRVYTKIKEMLLTHKDLLLKFEEMEKKLAGQDEKIYEIFNYLKQFINEQTTPRKEVGFKSGKEKQ